MGGAFSYISGGIESTKHFITKNDILLKNKGNSNIIILRY